MHSKNSGNHVFLPIWNSHNTSDFGLSCFLYWQLWEDHWKSIETLHKHWQRAYHLHLMSGLYYNICDLKFEFKKFFKLTVAGFPFLVPYPCININVHISLPRKPVPVQVPVLFYKNTDINYRFDFEICTWIHYYSVVLYLSWQC